MDKRNLILNLLCEPEKLKRKKPFTRGFERDTNFYYPDTIGVGDTIDACAPQIKKRVVPQEVFLRELDPNSHDVLFDDNIPSLCVKIADSDYREIKYQRMSVPIQREIKNKQVMHLTANQMQFTLMDTEPTDEQLEDFITFKQYWHLRNQDGMKTKMVDTQLSCGDAGLLYYFDYNGEIKSRILSFADGYILCPHNDQNGDRILESVYYSDGENEYIDSYDDTYMYRYTKSIVYDGDETSSWVLETPIRHGFSEIPLITKRGEVAWNNVQPIIEAYEVLYNVFNAIQKRFGWGIFYVKGRFKDTAQKIAGSVVLNNTSVEGNGDAKFLTPPTPQGTIDTLQLMLESIQLGSSTTFLLPKDVKMSGDISGIAIMLTQSLDMENALQKVIEWQNVADKMVRLFKEGLAKELVNKGINETAISRFESLHINAKFKVWRPLNEYEYNQMLTILTGAGILSKESGIELNTVSKPDEKKRIEKQEKEAQAVFQQQQQAIQEESIEQTATGKEDEE
jgi:hypothetical protein